MVKNVQFWKWILSKRKQKDSSAAQEDDLESQKQVEEGKKDEIPVPNGGILSFILYDDVNQKSIKSYRALSLSLPFS